jgi:hypothetical protein
MQFKIPCSKVLLDDKAKKKIVVARKRLLLLLHKGTTNTLKHELEIKCSEKKNKKEY